MPNAKVGVVGYGVIGQRLADGVAHQKDMDLLGVVDVKPTLAVKALKEKGMPYDLYGANEDSAATLREAGFPVSGTMEDVLEKVDIILDATAAGIGKKNKKLYQKHDVNAIFQGGEESEVADVFFHGYANFDKGVGKDYLKLTSCNTTGLIRTVDCLDKHAGIEKVAITIIRRSADPGDTHRGYIDLAKVEPVPNHQAEDLMTIMPHIDATGVLANLPITHGHIISVVATPKEEMSDEGVVNTFKRHPRIRVVSIEEGFNSNTALFRYARNLGNPRGDMYEVGLFEETIAHSGRDILYTFNVPQEAVVIPETMDGIRASLEMQPNQEEAVDTTNNYLSLK